MTSKDLPLVRENLLQEGIFFAKRLERIPTSKDYLDFGKGNMRTKVRDAFKGGWNEFITLISISIYTENIAVSMNEKKHIIDEIRQMARFIGYIPNREQYIDCIKSKNPPYPSMEQINMAFSTWGKAKNIAFPNGEIPEEEKKFGENVKETKPENTETLNETVKEENIKILEEREEEEIKDWNKEDSEILIKELRILEKELGRIPTEADISKKNGCSGKNAYKKVFGSYPKALKIAFNFEKVIIAHGADKRYIVDNKIKFEGI